MTLVGGTEINGTFVEIHASKYGDWSIDIPAEEEGKPGKEIGRGDTLNKAKSNARIELRKKATKVKVEFITLAGEGGVATGLNSRDNRVLTHMEDDSKPQLDYNERVFKYDTPDEVIDRYNEIEDEQKNLRLEQRNINTTYTFSLGSRVRGAIEEASVATA